jgi:hypothetical protein
MFCWKKKWNCSHLPWVSYFFFSVQYYAATKKWEQRAFSFLVFWNGDLLLFTGKIGNRFSSTAALFPSLQQALNQKSSQLGGEVVKQDIFHHRSFVDYVSLQLLFVKGSNTSHRKVSSFYHRYPGLLTRSAVGSFRFFLYLRSSTAWYRD